MNCTTQRCNQGRKPCPTPNSCGMDDPITTPEEAEEAAMAVVQAIVGAIVLACAGLAIVAALSA